MLIEGEKEVEENRCPEIDFYRPQVATTAGALSDHSLEKCRLGEK